MSRVWLVSPSLWPPAVCAVKKSPPTTWTDPWCWRRPRQTLTARLMTARSGPGSTRAAEAGGCSRRETTRSWRRPSGPASRGWRWWSVAISTWSTSWGRSSTRRTRQPGKDRSNGTWSQVIGRGLPDSRLRKINICCGYSDVISDINRSQKSFTVFFQVQSLSVYHLLYF